MTQPRYDIEAYDYDLPPEQIAQEPAARRDASRLVVLDRETDALTHAVFRDLPQFLRPGDLLVLNDTRVIRARVHGLRATGGMIEVFFLRELEPGKWEALLRSNGKPRPGEWVSLAGGAFRVRLIERLGRGAWVVATPRGDMLALLDEVGETPLPPYIHREPHDARADMDRERYQTVYAARPGAVAAPTAGLHFTPAVFEALERKGVGRTFVTLHVGAGTFRPIERADIRSHRMHAEVWSVAPETVERIRATRADGGRVIPVGTTACRVLETLARDGLEPGGGETSLYIKAPYAFGLTDAILTNFHLPRSTLLVMISAFAGRERLLAAYAECRDRGYRFYSYGDAMLVV